MLDLQELIRSIGYIGVTAIVFAENGLLIGFFLPGDSLLFTAGFLASQGYFNIWTLTILLYIASVLGVGVGYWFGKKWGRRLFPVQNLDFSSVKTWKRLRSSTRSTEAKPLCSHASFPLSGPLRQ